MSDINPQLSFEPDVAAESAQVGRKPPEARPRSSKISVPWRALTMVGSLALIWIVFSFTTDGTFLLPRNVSLLARQMAVTGILATGMVMVIVAGQIDLSVGAMTGLLGALSAMAYVRAGWPLWAAFGVAMVVGSVLGLLQGCLVAWLSIPPFIVTLGGMLLFQGALLGLTGGVSTSPSPTYLYIGQAYLPAWLGWVVLGLILARVAYVMLGGSKANRLRWIGIGILATAFTSVMNAYAGVPLPVLLLLVLGAIYSLVAKNTRFGRHLYAIGGNREAAFFSGVHIERHIVAVFTLMGFMAGIAGIVLTARVGSATSDAGRMMELDAIAAAVIGGTSLLGGQGTVAGALLGALVMASLDNGMSLMNTESFWQPIIKGTILVLAVGIDMASRKGSAK